MEEEDIENIRGCINHTAFLNGVNSAYELYKLDTDWKNKVQEDKKLVAKQLRGVSMAIENVQEEIKEVQKSGVGVALLGTGLKLEVISKKQIKNGSLVSGDSTVYQKLKNGKILLGISDGMGSGETAAKSSQKLLELLEKYLNAGLEKNVAIDLMNSYMMVGENKEKYATLDALLFNEDNGETDIIKFGACPTYLLIDGVVKTISSKSLPVGAIINVEGEIFREKLERGTIVVMVSDGVLEANSQKEKWIKNLLESIQTEDAQKIAEMVIQEALDANLGIAKDDMTVTVMKVC